jgi:hypothetical protein
MALEKRGQPTRPSRLRVMMLWWSQSIAGLQRGM